MKKILLTGFESFSDISINPSETLVKNLCILLNQKKEIQCDAFILPVDYSGASQIIDSLDLSKYDFIFEFGVAAKRSKVSLERVGLNWIESTLPDNSGKNIQPQKISSSQESALFNSLSLTECCLHINHMFPDSAEVSLSAGGYLCNYVYFKTLLRTNQCLFIHIPLNLNFNQQILASNELGYMQKLSDISVQIINFLLKSN